MKERKVTCKSVVPTFGISLFSPLPSSVRYKPGVLTIAYSSALPVKSVGITVTMPRTLDA